MKTILPGILLSLSLIILGNTQVKAQEFPTAVSYMEYLGTEFSAISRDLWSYMKTSAHSRSGRKIDNRRKQLIETTDLVRKKIAAMPSFEGDASYRDAFVEYLKLNVTVLKEDYDKILDLEEIAEQSYDYMEAYLLAKEKAGEKMDIAYDKLQEIEKKFAEGHKIQLIEGESKLTNKIETANEVIKYYNVVYLLFFKSYKQEAYLIEAMNKNDVNAMEQTKNSLLKYAQEDTKKLDTLKNFKNDASLKTSCRSLLTFYQTESKTKMPIIIDFYLKKESFEKMSKTMESKAASQRTKAEIDQYNAAVKAYNAAIANFNKENEYLNKTRSQLLDQWNKAVQDFMDKHVP
ncbi:MAG: hypothetical protein NW226_23350 [Microscillaceae bacterium]|nr:hypothetical protein [Microscillaceae bacterium]